MTVAHIENSSSDALAGEHWCHRLDTVASVYPRADGGSQLQRGKAACSDPHVRELQSQDLKNPFTLMLGNLGSELGRGLNKPHWPHPLRLVLVRVSWGMG